MNANRKNPPTIEQDSTKVPEKSKRVKTDTGAGATYFIVYTRSPCTVRISEGDFLIAEVSSSTLATVRDKMGPGAGGTVSAAAASVVVVKTDDSDDRWTDERGLLSRGTWKRREGTSGE